MSTFFLQSISCARQIFAYMSSDMILIHLFSDEILIVYVSNFIFFLIDDSEELSGSSYPHPRHTPTLNGIEMPKKKKFTDDEIKALLNKSSSHDRELQQV